MLGLKLGSDAIGHKLSPFEAFYERHKSKMYHTANRVLNDRFLAEDAVQTAILRISRAFDRLSFATSEEEAAYALLAAKHAALDELEKHKPFLEAAEYSDELGISTPEHMTFRQVSNKETQDEVIRLIDTRLDERAQTVLRYKCSGLRDKEIALTLDISVSLVSTITLRARTKLKRNMEKEGIELGQL